MLDELTPIAQYMAHEMNTNAHSRDAQRMHELNNSSAEKCINEYIHQPLWRRLFGAIPPQACMQIEISSRQAALLMWTGKVMQDSEWDHKPIIRARFISATSGNGAWHAYKDRLYFYDIWSNIHYGYVGAAAGFSKAKLLDGAGLEQIGSDLLRLQLPTKRPGVQGLRAFDDTSDSTSIEVGIDLHSTDPRHVSTATLVQTVIANTASFTTKPLPAKTAP